MTSHSHKTTFSIPTSLESYTGLHYKEKCSGADKGTYDITDSSIHRPFINDSNYFDAYSCSAAFPIFCHYEFLGTTFL
jgi:hypothetical protein